MTIKSKHEQEVEAELKGLLSGALSAKDVLSKPVSDTVRVGPSGRPSLPLLSAMDKTAAGLREVRASPALAAPYAPDNHDSRDPLDRIFDLLARLETRTVRMETRITNTMRFMGFPPRAPLTESPMGQAVWRGDDLLVTGPNVPVRDLNWAISRRAPEKDVRIILNNVHWATVHIQPQAVNGIEKREGE
jgi:hypothetical protein